ncbi:MAG: NnrS family protein [Terriglobales bacterium]
MYATVTENRLGKQLDPEEIFQIQREREMQLSRLLILFITTGIAFMLLPGTFLGVWNLVTISSRHAALGVAPAWIQAHGHAQVLGWIGTFILGIGFYSLPKLRRMKPFALRVAWLTWGLWTAGVALRWITTVYLWYWRFLLPASAVLELLAFALFFHAVSGHRPLQRPGVENKPRLEMWVIVVIVATLGFLGTLLANTVASFYLALHGGSPAFPTDFNHGYLTLAAWGFMVPFVWGFSAKWLPVFLALKPLKKRRLVIAMVLSTAGVVVALAGKPRPAAILLLHGAMLAPSALRIFSRTERPAKTKGVHPSFPGFVRLAYVWLRIAAMLTMWGAASRSVGVNGAARHALTVGFISTMVFAIGQRVLPAFSGMRLLFSTRLMLVNLLLLNVGCLLRVGSEIIAYQGYASWGWSVLPVSALIELTAVTVFALNLLVTFAQRPAPALQFAEAE